jgi:hypothetical protein
LVIEIDYDLDISTIPTDETPLYAVIPLSTQSFFLGKLKFVVDHLNASSNEVALLHFAWHFRQVHRWIELGLTEPYKIEIEGTAYELVFTKDGGRVRIEYDSQRVFLARNTAVIPSSPVEYKSIHSIADADPAELSRKLRSFYRRVYRKCAKLYPALKDQPFQDWLYYEKNISP